MSNLIEPKSSDARAFHSLRVAAVQPQTREAVAVTFDVPTALRDRFAFTAGQFVTLEAEIDGERVRRSYSICAAPSERALRVAIKRVDDGRFSTWAHDALRVGATIAVGSPEGRFHVPLDESHHKHYVFFAAGSGITPIVALVRHILEIEPLSRITLVYANRSSASVMFRDELQNLKDRYLARLALLFVMSREPQDVPVLGGRIDREKCDALLDSWIDPTTIDAAFVCGPQDMTKAVIASLEARGVAKERVKSELFVAAARTGSARGLSLVRGHTPDVQASALLDGQTRSFPIERGRETVLDAGLRAGLDLPYSCKGGVCSTCRVMLTAGEVDMDVRYALEDYEIARGFILMCQSYPVSDVIAIDVDSHSHT